MGDFELSVLNNATYAAFTVAVVALPVLLVNWFKYMKQVRSLRGPAFLHWAYFPTKSVLFFVVPILSVFAITSVMTWEVRSQVLAALSESPIEVNVAINGVAPNHPSAVMAALKSLAPAAAHHSHPTRMITVQIQKPGVPDVVLMLGRDSGRPQEYWVFFPRYRVTATNEIGRINTEVLNAY